MSYVYDRMVFHCTVDDGLTFMAMADEEFSRRLAFAFLEDAKKRFRTAFGERAKTAVALGMNSDFSSALRRQMEFFSSDPSADRLAHVGSEVDSAKQAMVSNIEKVLERGEKVELLVDKTSALSNNSVRFKKSATQLKNVLWWKNAKLMAVIGVVLLLVVYVVLAIACGGVFFQGCWASSPTSG